MCYSSAQQQNPQQARALNYGILILLVPSLLVFAGVMITAARRRESEPDEGAAQDSLRLDLNP